MALFYLIKSGLFKLSYTSMVITKIGQRCYFNYSRSQIFIHGYWYSDLAN